MPTLVLPPRYTSDSIALARVATIAGWDVERLTSWRVPEWLIGKDVVLYGEPLFAAIVAEPLGIALLEPPSAWLASLPSQYLKRAVHFAHLGDARRLTVEAFVKPVEDKCFQAGVYPSGESLPAPEVIPDSTPVLISEPVMWEIEFRCFILNEHVVTLSPYWRDGQLAQAPDGSWDNPRTEQAEQYANNVLRDPAIALPPAVVLDVGQIAGRGWAIVEANAAWGSGIYGCDPTKVLDVVRRACLPINQLSANDRLWISPNASAV